MTASAAELSDGDDEAIENHQSDEDELEDSSADDHVEENESDTDFNPSDSKEGSQSSDNDNEDEDYEKEDGTRHRRDRSKPSNSLLYDPNFTAGGRYRPMRQAREKKIEQFEPNWDSKSRLQENDGNRSSKKASRKRGRGQSQRSSRHRRLSDDDDSEEEEESEQSDSDTVVYQTRTRYSSRVNQPVSYNEDEAFQFSDSDSASDKEEKRNAKERDVPAFASDEADNEVSAIEQVLGYRNLDKSEIRESSHTAWQQEEVEYYIKWKGKSHLHCSWEKWAALEDLPGLKRLQNFIRKQEEEVFNQSFMSAEELELENIAKEMEAQLLQQYREVDRVIAERQIPSGEVEYLIKWEGLPYSEATWENLNVLLEHTDCNVQAAVDNFQERESQFSEVSRSAKKARSEFVSDRSRYSKFTEQPPWLKFGKLRDYQLDGLNWLVFSWAKDKNGILADEMGLGKTVQCVSMLGVLKYERQLPGPFLVVVPLSVISNWLKEFKRWTPSLNVVVYIGNSISREVIREYEFYTDRKSGRKYKFHVLLTTYELVMKDKSILNKIRWCYMMVDEAHRLKNKESQLYTCLKEFFIENILLVTGTPLQNNLRELWALMHFIEPQKFSNIEEFETKYSIEEADKVATLHKDIGPHLLRRVVKDVEKSLPPKIERILRVEMSPMQRDLYEAIVSQNFDVLRKGVKGVHTSLLNVAMELKKCCNHPFLFESVYTRYGNTSQLRNVVAVSGKMRLLDKLLASLQKDGHRVLIFSQMVRMLDILEDYLRMRGLQFQRLDGSTSSEKRQQAMDHFNADGSQDFCFLLSTRAGGLGLNLATADTVIIFDSDWNPQNDLQAMSRAHRIGQDKTVNIYRFVSKSGVEEKILRKAKEKMVLDQIVIQKMDTSGRTVLSAKREAKTAGKQFSKDDLAEILRFGAEELFRSKKADEEAGKSLDADGDANPHEELDLDEVLARAESVDAGATSAVGDLMSGFKVAEASFQEDDETFWSRLIRPEDRGPSEEELRQAQLEASGPRQAALDASKRLKQDGLSDASFKASPRSGIRPKRCARDPAGHKSAKVSKSFQTLLDTATVHIDTWPNVAKEDLPIPTFKEAKEMSTLLEQHRKEKAVEVALSTVCSKSNEHSVLKTARRDELELLYTRLLEACECALAAAKAGGEDVTKVVIDFFGYPVLAQKLHARAIELTRLSQAVSMFKDPYSQFRIIAQARVLPPPRWAKLVNWEAKHDAMLLLGVHLFGFNHWDEIRNAERLGLGGMYAPKNSSRETSEADNDFQVGKRRSQTSLPDYKQIETRVSSLLKKLAEAEDEREDRNDQKKRKATEKTSNQGTDRHKKQRISAKEARGAHSKVKSESNNVTESTNRSKPSLNEAGDTPKEWLKAVHSDIKHMRSLKTKTGLNKREIAQTMKACLIKIGACVESVLAERKREKSSKEVPDSEANDFHEKKKPLRPNPSDRTLCSLRDLSIYSRSCQASKQGCGSGLPNSYHKKGAQEPVSKIFTRSLKRTVNLVNGSASS